MTKKAKKVLTISELSLPEDQIITYKPESNFIPENIVLFIKRIIALEICTFNKMEYKFYDLKSHRIPFVHTFLTKDFFLFKDESTFKMVNSDYNLELIKKFSPLIYIRDPNDLYDERRKIEHFLKMFSSLTENIEWTTKSTRGSLIKRIDSAIYKTRKSKHGHWLINDKTKFSLSEKAKGMIANLLESVTTSSREYNFDITHNLFSWEAGDFGDSGSCFWASRKKDREMMQKDNKFAALRFFKKVDPNPICDVVSSNKLRDKFYKNYTSIARSWLWKAKFNTQVNSKLELKSNVFVVFNGYGMRSVIQAAILSSHLKLPMKKIDILYDGKEAGKLWINGDAIAITNKGTLDKISKLDLKFN